MRYEISDEEIIRLVNRLERLNTSEWIWFKQTGSGDTILYEHNTYVPNQRTHVEIRLSQDKESFKIEVIFEGCEILSDTYGKYKYEKGFWGKDKYTKRKGFEQLLTFFSQRADPLKEKERIIIEQANKDLEENRKQKTDKFFEN